MKTADKILQEILSLLKNTPELAYITFKPAFETGEFVKPVKAPVASVGIESTFTDVRTSRITGTYVRERTVSIAVEVLTPIKSGGTYCAVVLEQIANCLFRERDIHIKQSVKTQTPAFHNSSCAFQGKLALSITEQLQSKKPDLNDDYEEISIEINGCEVLFVQNIAFESLKNTHPIACIGQSEPVCYIENKQEHKITVEHFVTPDERLELFELDDFDMLVKTAGRSILFAGCFWEELTQTVQSGLCFTQKAVIRAKTRTMTED